MYFIEIYDKTNGNSWKVIKLKHSNKLSMIYRSLLEEEMY